VLELYLDKFSQVVDDELTRMNGELNNTVMFFTVFQLGLLPFVVISGLFGMNVKVPW
jgi:Mg2+ and Co2+ transporter CorA